MRTGPKTHIVSFVHSSAAERDMETVVTVNATRSH